VNPTIIRPANALVSPTTNVKNGWISFNPSVLGRDGSIEQKVATITTE